MLENIKWLGHASFKVTGEKIIYIDPWNLKKKEKADIILITHPHYDHLSSKDISKIQVDETIIIIPEKDKGELKGRVKRIKPGDSLSIDRVTIKAVPAYNINKTYHPKEKGWVGYIIETGGFSIYHAGDTDFIPEMKKIKVDIALLPVGGTYTMDAEEAAKACRILNPKIAIPMHYGDVVGSEEDAKKFKEMSPVKVEILKKEE
ncbi:MBL fold metallo-hydrolase [Candidatus Aerophobetes bacterium]|nr:MBL fold metallo-hydrolase [Candidatus Aerophobetes bacterium]